ncbi:MAG: histone deacetylase [Phycisphaerae bacterium]
MKPSPKLGILFDERFQHHQTAMGHPERPRRLDAVRSGLQRAQAFDRDAKITPVPATDDDLHRVHDAAYVKRLTDACAVGAPLIDCADSSICPESESVARLAAGGVLAATRRVAGGELQRAFCAVRPPGHHAEGDRSMGFCLYNNIALAARCLQREFNAERILILDWDVHHGNGTQHTFDSDPGIFFVSLHGDPAGFYPHTGYENEIGTGAGKGFTRNICMNAGAGDEAYRKAFDENIAPIVAAFRPEYFLLSAGFDAHEEDPLGITSLSDEMYDWMTNRVVQWADEFCKGRIISILEGGYDLGVLERCVDIHVRALRR